MLPPRLSEGLSGDVADRLLEGQGGLDLAHDLTADAQASLGWTPQSIRRRAFRGAMALGFRQAFVVAINLVGGVCLARILSPSQFGLFAVFTFALSLLAAFGDVGLGASLIRSTGKPTTHEYRVVFTAQQMLLLVGVIGLFVAAPFMAEAYRLPPENAWLFRLVSLSLIPTSLQVIPSIQLERDLRFERLAVVEVSQTVVYNAAAVLLTLAGYGVWGLAIALLVRSMSGAVLANLVSPWSIGFAWDSKLVRQHVGFGLPYQASAWVSLAKDSLNPVLVGLLLGAAQVGYLNWANTLAAFPVLALMMLQRLYLPAFARMQQHPAELGRLVELVIRGTNTIAAPLSVLCLVLAEPITRIVFGDKWLPALPYFYLLWMANLAVATATPLYILLSAIGRSRTAFGFALLWMVATWVLAGPLIAVAGALGFAAGNAMVQLSVFLLIVVARRHVPFRLSGAVLPPWAIAGAMGSIVIAFQYLVPVTNIVLLGLVGVSALGMYVLATGLLFPTDARKVWALIRERA
jgi:O-antigen/teichoic acid export membrane protein